MSGCNFTYHLVGFILGDGGSGIMYRFGLFGILVLWCLRSPCTFPGSVILKQNQSSSDHNTPSKCTWTYYLSRYIVISSIRLQLIHKGILRRSGAGGNNPRSPSAGSNHDLVAMASSQSNTVRISSEYKDREYIFRWFLIFFVNEFIIRFYPQIWYRITWSHHFVGWLCSDPTRSDVWHWEVIHETHRVNLQHHHSIISMH